MKQLMLGNQALARGLFEAGCGFVSSYPGTPSTEITECIAEYPEVYAEWAPNEKVAMEAAFGAALAGKRSFCGMKHVGLNVAADPLFTIAYTGINAGMVIAVADDPGMHSSQNEQDSRNYAKAAKVPMLEPSDSAEALAFAKLAYDLSEQFDTPVLIKMCTRVAHSQSVVELSDRVEAPLKPYTKQPSKYIMMPGFAKLRHPVVEDRLKALADYAATASVNVTEEGENNDIGIITGSTSYQYVKEVCGNTYPILKLGMVWPLSEKLLKDFASKVKKVIVIEEGDGFVEEFCKNIGIEAEGKNRFSNIGELSQNLVAKGLGLPFEEGVALDDVIPNRPPALCAGCPHRGIYYVLSKLKLTVIGDIGCYTLGAIAPLNSVDSVICMGASISGIHGFNKAQEGASEGKTVAVIGDSTFMHSGMTGLVNVA
ncbi:MAG: indolepyruvate ferredoxin oxidoreductase subunit alpha, partial [Oscillospiraceae bacterium]|nr:indolepyruvate ferredoxin oxidoreductase subunit alpha [Oscillospiraceae bacterium]